MTYALRLGEDEVARYRMMAERAREREADLWQRAGLVPGARVADVGCGPGAMTALLAERVGSVVGVDGDAEAVDAARAMLAGCASAEVRVGRADDTGLDDGAFDVVVMRHVLAHNGGSEQRIVDHLARLVRPGGHVYLVDTDIAAASMSPADLPSEDLQARYAAWHAEQGNDPRIGRRLADLGQAAGLEVEEFRGWFEIGELPPGMRGPAWAAREVLVASGSATRDDVERWGAALEEIDRMVPRPRFMLPAFAAVLRRPGPTAQVVDDPEAVCVRSIQIMADGDPADFEAVVHPEARNREDVDEPPASRGRGPAAFYATAQWLRAAYADLSWEVHDVVVDGALVVVHATMRGRQVGTFVGYDADARPARAFPPTGRSFATTQTHWFRMADGLVIEHWANRDDLGTAAQLGWNPPSPAYLVRMLLATRRARRAAASG